MKKRRAKRKRISTEEMVQIILKHPRTERKIQLAEKLKRQNYN